jgi:superfamily II DNA/RNA helicase
VDAFTHRIGRTGRASRTGEAFTFASREDGKIINQIERALGKKMSRNNIPGLTEEFPFRPVSDGQPGKKSWQHKAKKNGRPAGRRNGHPAGRAAKPAGAGKQEQPPARHRKAGSRQKRRSRAAMMVDGSGNLFLNP